MEQTNSIALFLKLVFELGVLTLFWPLMFRALIKALNDFVDIFRGGPPTPMHPSPVDDAALLRRRRSKQD
jgi:hypothetical protein